MTETKRMAINLVDAIEIHDDLLFDPPTRWIEIISYRGWNDPGFDEHQAEFQRQADDLLRLLGFDPDETGGSSEGPESCSVEAYKEMFRPRPTLITDREATSAGTSTAPASRRRQS